MVNRGVITAKSMIATIPSNLLSYDPDNLERVFNRLAQNVLAATRSESSPQRISMYPAYPVDYWIESACSAVATERSWENQGDGFGR